MRRKRAGRGVYHFFEAQMDAKLQARRAFEMDLRLAFQNEEFEVHYQPIVETASGAIIGCEALLRWRHASAAMFPPATSFRLPKKSALSRRSANGF